MTTDRHVSTEAGAAESAWLSQAATWFALAAAGMVTVFIGLAIDAWRHNNGAGEESLLSLSNPGHLVAGIGLAITSLAVLSGLTVSLLRNVQTSHEAVRRFVPLTAAWVVVAVAAVGSLVYISASGVTVGHGHDDSASVAAGDHAHPDGTDGGDAGVAVALEEEGLLDGDADGVDPNTVAGALTRGASGHPTGKHDHGKHATFTQMMELDDDDLAGMFPEGIVQKDDIAALREELKAVRAVAEQLNTPDKALAAGFVQTTNDVPFMGEHWLNFTYVRDGIFDPARPEGLLFSTIDGEKQLVGVWFLQLPGVCPAGTANCVTREVEPVGFTSDLDLWHAHIGLCIVGLSGASEGETRESCEAKGGRYTADLRWMMHVWVTPETTENADGFFAYLNSDLYEKQAAQQRSGSPSGTTQ